MNIQVSKKWLKSLHSTNWLIEAIGTHKKRAA